MVVFGHLDRKLYPFALALMDWQLPYGIIAHDVEIYRHPAYRTNDLIIRGKMVRGAKWIAANSRHTKSLVEMWGISKDKIMIVHPPVSGQVIQQSTICNSLGKDSNYTLVTISRLVKSKGIDIVLRALKILKENGIPYRYVIVGDGEERPFLEGLVDHLEMRGNVQFWGYIAEEQKSALLHRADVFVMPSRVNPRLHHEGFGLAFLEAAVFGIPGVGSRAGGIPDAVVHEETGLLVPQESPEELSRALIFLYQNPEKRKKWGKRPGNGPRVSFRRQP